MMTRNCVRGPLWPEPVEVVRYVVQSEEIKRKGERGV